MNEALTIGAYAAAVLMLPHAAIQAPREAAPSIPIPLDDSWQVETYRAGKTSRFGALGITSLKRAGATLAVTAALAPKDLNRRQGEIIREIDDLNLGPYIDLVEAEVVVKINVPAALRTAAGASGAVGAQVFVETESVDGVRARQYGYWHNLTEAAEEVTIAPTALAPLAYTDGPAFDPVRVTAVGFKLALDDQATARRTGTVVISAARIDFPSANRRAQAQQRMREARPEAPDATVLARLPPLALGPEGGTWLPVARDGGPLRSAFQSVGEIGKDGASAASRVWEARARFDKYQPAASARTASVQYEIRAPLDLRNQKLVAWAAVGSALRGARTRPNMIYLELRDERGRVFQGPAVDVSAEGSVVAADGSRSARWVRVEISAHDLIPPTPGYVQPGVDLSKVTVALLKLEIAKHADGPGLRPYPLDGSVRLSSIRVERIARFPTPPWAEPYKIDATEPVPVKEFLVGVNYAFLHYGTDFGVSPYGRASCGVSAHRGRLTRDFRELRAHGVRLVRFFLLDDLRTGMVTGKDGLPAGLDRCVAKDLTALMEVARQTDIRLMPVLIDFRVADGFPTAGDATAHGEGEVPEIFLRDDFQRAFIDKVLAPIVKQIEQFTRRNPGLIYAIDVANELENSWVLRKDFEKAFEFVKAVREMIRKHAFTIPATLGSRNRDDLATLWPKRTQLDSCTYDSVGRCHPYFTDLEIWQFHHYDKFDEQEGRKLDFPVEKLGLDGPVLVGEVEPTDVEQKLTTLRRNRYAGALFWNYQARDGFRVDLKAIARWVKANP